MLTYSKHSIHIQFLIKKFKLIFREREKREEGEGREERGEQRREKGEERRERGEGRGQIVNIVLPSPSY